MSKILQQFGAFELAPAPAFCSSQQPGAATAREGTSTRLCTLRGRARFRHSVNPVNLVLTGRVCLGATTSLGDLTIWLAYNIIHNILYSDTYIYIHYIYIHIIYYIYIIHNIYIYILYIIYIHNIYKKYYNIIYIYMC